MSTDHGSAKDVSDEVQALALSVLKAHEEESMKYARETIMDSLEKVKAGLDSRYMPAPVSFPSGMVGLSGGIPPSGSPGLKKAELCLACKAVERAAVRLGSVSAAVRKKGDRAKKRRDVLPISMRMVLPVPRFDAWVPVSKEFWISEEFMVEPYMPWFGDEETERGDAYKVYRKMANASGDDEVIVSDGEIATDGRFLEPDGQLAWQTYDSKAEHLNRSGRRKVLLAICQKFDRNDPVVIDTLVKVLNLSSRFHASKILGIAETRRSQANEEKKKEVAQKDVARRAAEAWMTDCGVDHCDESWDADEAVAPLSFFCFTCHVFHCPRHEGQNVEPIVPIKDSFVEYRAASWRKLKSGAGEGEQPRVGFGTGVSPCGDDCVLNPASKTSVSVPASDDECRSMWSKEERILLREALGIFKNDFCSIAKVVGPSKTCLQTAMYMQLPDVMSEVNKITNDMGKKRWPISRNRGGFMRGAPCVGGNGKSLVDEADTENDRVPCPRRAKFIQKSASAGAEEDEFDQEADFVPCAHVGPCDKASCRCFAKGLNCEATCGCNAGRWTSRGYDVPSSKCGVNDLKRLCSRRTFGCQCGPGSHCNTNECACWNDQRSCDPDFCSHCQASVLPSHMLSVRRGCRNVGVLTGRHKRTIIGRSSVHGFGLFAGEVFEEGDMVGIYGGGIMDTKAADRIGHLYDAKDHTFFFDVTQSLVVDGGMLGMKSKFVNHVRPGSSLENCGSRAVRVRGMVHVALFATRRVEIGEEFRFDYKFQEIIPDWAQPAGKPARLPSAGFESARRNGRRGGVGLNNRNLAGSTKSSEDEYAADDENDVPDVGKFAESEDSCVVGP